MKNIQMTLIAVFAIINVSFCQNIKLIKATSQNWSGGVCCRFGTNYSIIIQTKNKEIIPDTVWINGYYYSLKFDTVSGYPNDKKVDVIHNITAFTINVGETHDERDNTLDKLILDKDNSDKNSRNNNFFGAAIISYIYKNKQCYFKVKEFESLTPIAYP